MKLSDIIALAKQGYKPEDVERLISLSDTDVNEGSTGDEGAQNDAPDTQLDNTQPETDVPEGGSDEPDYKSLYEETVKQLKAAQAANVKDKVPEEPVTTMDEALLNMMNKIL